MNEGTRSGTNASREGEVFSFVAARARNLLQQGTGRSVRVGRLRKPSGSLWPSVNPFFALFAEMCGGFVTKYKKKKEETVRLKTTGLVG